MTSLPAKFLQTMTKPQRQQALRPGLQGSSEEAAWRSAGLRHHQHRNSNRNRLVHKSQPGPCCLQTSARIETQKSAHLSAVGRWRRHQSRLTCRQGPTQRTGTGDAAASVRTAGRRGRGYCLFVLVCLSPCLFMNYRKLSISCKGLFVVMTDN